MESTNRYEVGDMLKAQSDTFLGKHRNVIRVVGLSTKEEFYKQTQLAFEIAGYEAYEDPVPWNPYLVSYFYRIEALD